MATGRILIAVFSLLFIFRAHTLFAQFVDYNVVVRPRGVSYQVLSGEHFEVIFQRDYLDEARSALITLEAHYEPTHTMVGSRRKLRVPVVLNGYSDLSNGYVTASPFKQEVEAVAIRGLSLSPAHTSWIDTVFPHELVHAMQADLQTGFGIGAMIRPFAPDVARTFNLTLPPGISEGMAVYYESTYSGAAGRLNHAFFTMRFRAAMASARRWSMSQLVEIPAYTRPFDRHYLGGAHFVRYMASRDSLAFFRRSTNLNYRLPLLGYGIGLWYGSKTWPRRIYRAFLEDARQQEADRRRLIGETTQPAVIAGGRGLVHRRPQWIDDSTVVAIASGYNLRSGFYTYDLRTGARRLLRVVQPEEDMMYSVDAERLRLIYAHYKIDPLVATRAVSELYEIDLASGAQRQLTHRGRVFAPVPAPGGALWAIRNDGSLTRWVSVEADGAVDLMMADAEARIVQVSPAPDGASAIAVVNRRGVQGLFTIDPGAAERRMTPLIVFDDASVYDASWSADGEYILFTADLSDRLNVFAYRVSDRGLWRLTNALYGAFDPALSPDGRTLAFIHYRHERYDLATIEFDLESALPVPLPDNQVSTTTSRTPLPDSTTDAMNASLPTPEAYRWRRYMRPRMIAPALYYDDGATAVGDTELGLGLGLSIQGIDPLQKVRYLARGFVQADRLWGRLEAETASPLIRPRIALYQTPSTVLALVRDEMGGTVDTLRVGRQRQGVAVGARLPVTFERNVFSSGMNVALDAIWQRERLFTGDKGSETPFREEVTLQPALTLYYRLQANPRDPIPNHGLVLSIASELDLEREQFGVERAVIALLTGYLPFLRRRNIGLKVQGGLLSQNRGSIYNLERFMPRGYEDRFIGAGTFSTLRFEYVQPLIYIDNGLFFLPAYVKSLYAFGFFDALAGWKGEENLTSAGVGAGLQFRLWYLFNIDLRYTVSYRFQKGDWSDRWW